MPYQESSYFKTPDKSDPLWRYMHIDKFLAMLNGKSLIITESKLLDR